MRSPKKSTPQKPLSRGGSWDEMPKRAQIEGFRPAWQEMPNLELAFTAGKGYALMLAIYKCASRGQPIPAWAARGFIAGFRRVHDAECRSLDNVFGLPRAKNKHVKAIAARRALSLKIYQRIQNRKLREPGIGADLFDIVAGEFRTSRKNTSKLYYEAKAVIERPFVRNPDALANDSSADAVFDDDLFLHMSDEPDPLLDCDDPILP